MGCSAIGGLFTKKFSVSGYCDVRNFISFLLQPKTLGGQELAGAR
jgi:hypothetical protein